MMILPIFLTRKHRMKYISMYLCYAIFSNPFYSLIIEQHKYFWIVFDGSIIWLKRQMTIPN